MRLPLIISPALLALAALFVGCNSPVILQGGNYHPEGATITAPGAAPYTLSAPLYVIPEDTFRALLSE